jgi:hypothetical protein
MHAHPPSQNVLAHKKNTIKAQCRLVPCQGPHALAVVCIAQPPAPLGVRPTHVSHTESSSAMHTPWPMLTLSTPHPPSGRASETHAWRVKRTSLQCHCSEHRLITSTSKASKAGHTMPQTDAGVPGTQAVPPGSASNAAHLWPQHVTRWEGNVMVNEARPSQEASGYTGFPHDRGEGTYA